MTSSGCGHSSTDNKEEGRGRGAHTAVAVHGFGVCALPIRNHSSLIAPISFSVTLIFSDNWN